jgi:cytoskeletal protein RodZ
VKFRRKMLKRHSDHSDEERRWPGYLFGGHVRSSTLALILVLLPLWWVYDTYHTPEPPATQFVPPGFVPDPNYTWAPKSLMQPTSSATVTTTPTTTPETTTTTTTASSLFPQLPCLLPPPACPQTTSSATSTPSVEPGPEPTTSAPPS